MASADAFSASFGSVVRGFHAYKSIWTPVVNAVHPTQLEHGNPEDRYAVSVMKDTTIVGHVPREISRTCWYFIEREGEILCTIIGQRQRSVLLQGGLEIPCIYTFRGKKKLINKLKIIMKNMNLDEVV